MFLYLFFVCNICITLCLSLFVCLSYALSFFYCHLANKRVHFCLYLLNALAKSNIFGKLKQEFMSNTVLNDIYLYSLEGTTIK